MGGLGSGNWYRQRFHSTVESLPELIASDFNKLSGEIVAKARDENNRRISTFRYLRCGPNVVLFRTGTSDGTNIDTIEPILKLVSTKCNFGGTRDWLLCPAPNCGRHVQSLFINEHHSIGCRQCLGLLYESQYGGGIERKMTRLRSTQRQLLRGGVSQPIAVQQVRLLFQSLIDDLRKIERGGKV